MPRRVLKGDGRLARGLLGVAAVAAVGAMASVPACGDARSHIFVARVYDPVHNCVTPSEGLDVVDGPGPNGAACPPVCIVDTTGDIAVSGMCPPYPGEDTIEGADGGPLDPTCTKALAVYNCNVTCNVGDADVTLDGSAMLTDAEACLTDVDGGASDASKADTGAADGGGVDGAIDGAAEAGGADGGADAHRD